MPDPRPAAARILASIAALAVMLLAAAPALAGGDPVRDATETARKTTAQDPPDVPSTPTEDDDSEGHETEDPSPPDHASASLVEVEVEGEEVLTVGKTESKVYDSGRTTGDATVLSVGEVDVAGTSVGGIEVLGAHSDSRNGPQEDSAGPLDPVCFETLFCFALIQAHAESHEDGTSWSTSTVELAYLCILPADTETEDCEGIALVESGFSGAHAERRHRTGQTTAFGLAELFNICVELGIDSIGGCGGFLGAFAFATAPAENQLGEASRDSCIGFIEDDMLVLCEPEEPTAICLDSIVCIYLNQGETFLFVGGAAARQEAVHFGLNIDDEEVLTAHLAVAEALARNAGPEVAPAAQDRDLREVAAEGSELALTGFDLWSLLAASAALLLTGGGLMVSARERREA